MTAWDKEFLLDSLVKHKVSPNDIDYVICTHGHSDHIGNNNLFLNALHIVGFSVSRKYDYYNHSFTSGDHYVIDNNLSIVPTPGHTLSDVSVVVKNVESFGTVTITGDLFENENDLENDQIWINAGSEDESLQRKNRSYILSISDWIVPGHGKMFKVLKL
jgi:glyoxylase-like metal-dependent hydrolase (beta-lactamase superfamily II)